jgi:hypothetical protein
MFGKSTVSPAPIAETGVVASVAVLTKVPVSGTYSYVAIGAAPWG